MNNFALILLLALATIGCSAAPPLETARDVKVRELEERNARNERLLRAQALTTQEKRGGGPVFMVPPTAQIDTLRGVPQYIGSMHGPIKGCTQGARALRVTNSYDPNHLQLLVDGVGAVIQGARGIMPTLPPGKKAYFCLSSLGHHSVTAIAFEPDGLTPIPGNLGTATIEFKTGAYKRNIRFEPADFVLSN